LLPDPDATRAAQPLGHVEILEAVDRETLARLALAPRLVANLDPRLLRDILEAPPLSLTMALDGARVVGLVASALDDPANSASPRLVLVVGVEPGARRGGLATAMLQAHVKEFERKGTPWSATVTLAERDPIEPLDRAVRGSIANRIFERAGFASESPDRPLREADPGARLFVRG
jgi:GNAT superfamily N-acetyltransferase